MAGKRRRASRPAQHARVPDARWEQGTGTDSGFWHLRSLAKGYGYGDVVHQKGRWWVQTGVMFRSPWFWARIAFPNKRLAMRWLEEKALAHERWARTEAKRSSAGPSRILPLVHYEGDHGLAYPNTPIQTEYAAVTSTSLSTCALLALSFLRAPSPPYADTSDALRVPYVWADLTQPSQHVPLSVSGLLSPRPSPREPK